MLSFILSLSGSKSIPFPSYNPFVKVQVTWFTCDPFSKLLPTSSRTLAITVEWSSPVKTWYFSLAELIWSSYCHAVHVELLFLPLQAISCSMYSLSSNWGISPFAIPPWCHDLSLSYECALAFATLHQTNFLTLHLLLYGFLLSSIFTAFFCWFFIKIPTSLSACFIVFSETGFIFIKSGPHTDRALTLDEDILRQLAAPAYSFDFLAALPHCRCFFPLADWLHCGATLLAQAMQVNGILLNFVCSM